MPSSTDRQASARAQRIPGAKSPLKEIAMYFNTNISPKVVDEHEFPSSDVHQRVLLDPWNVIALPVFGSLKAIVQQNKHWAKRRLKNAGDRRIGEANFST